MAEWSNATVLKTVRLATVSRVRIPVSPPLWCVSHLMRMVFYDIMEYLQLRLRHTMSNSNPNSRLKRPNLEAAPQPANVDTARLANSPEDLALAENNRIELEVGKKLGIDNFEIKKFNPANKDLEYDLEKAAAVFATTTEKQLSEFSVDQLKACLDIANRLLLCHIASQSGAEYIEKLLGHLTTCETNSANAALFVQTKSVWTTHVNNPKLSEWLEGKGSGAAASIEDLVSIFGKYDIKTAADLQNVPQAALKGLDAAVRIADLLAAQPGGPVAHILYPNKFAVDFLMEAGQELLSPVSGTVTEVTECPYDFNLEIIEYANECKQNGSTAEAAKLNLLIPNAEVRNNTLKAIKDFLTSGETSFQQYIVIHESAYGRGSSLAIKDDQGITHRVIHAQSLVKTGDTVATGDPIVKLNYNSGMADALHIHYEAFDKDNNSVPLRAGSGSSFYSANMPGLDKYV